MIPDHANPIHRPQPIGQLERLPGVRRTCNRHEDCDAADARARKAGFSFADHCDDDCCEDCFGK